MECPNCHHNIYTSHVTEYQAIFSETHHLKELRTTNNPASQVEIHYVHKELLPAIKKDGSTVKKTLSELRAAVELLAKEKKRLTRLVHNFTSLISPLRRLSPELLMEIFNYACAGDWDWNDWTTQCHRYNTPYVLTHVCSRWRQVALSCPVIWSRISHRPDSKKLHSQAFSRALDMSFSRSRNFPLCIRMLRPWPPYDRCNEAAAAAAQAFLERISPHSARCRAVSFYIAPPFAQASFDILRGPHPLVQRLDIVFDHEITEVPQVGFSQYPSLRTVVLNHPKMITSDLPWIQITTLIIRLDVSWDSLTQVLRQCPSLQSLRTARVSVSTTRSKDDNGIMMTLKDLKCLKVTSQLLINHLCLPVLEVARLSSLYSPDPPSDVMESFRKLVWRSNCASRLTSLYTERISITRDLLLLLSHTPNLVVLDISAHVGTQTPKQMAEHEPDGQAPNLVVSLVSKLEVKPDEDPLFLPRLQHVSIRLSDNVGQLHYDFPYLADQDKLVRTLQSRWNVGSRVGLERLEIFKFWITTQLTDDSVRFSFAGEFSDETESALWLLVDDGMDISIRVRTELEVERTEVSVKLNFGSG